MEIIRPVGFERMLHGVAAKLALDPSSGDFDDVTVQRLARFLRERARQVWEFQFWPWGVTRTERRQYAADWSGATTYTAGAIVLSPLLAYKVALQSANTNKNPDTESAFWGPVDASFVKLVAYDQTWADEAFTDVDNVYEYDPRQHRYPRHVRFEHNAEGVVVTDYLAPARVWVQMRSRAPEFLAQPIWSTADAYAAGDVVFYEPTGDCYMALTSVAIGGDEPGTDADVWSIQVLPAPLADIAVYAAYADELAAGDGQLQKAQAERAVAERMLDDLENRVFADSGRLRRLDRKLRAVQQQGA